MKASTPSTWLIVATVVLCAAILAFLYLDNPLTAKASAEQELFSTPSSKREFPSPLSTVREVETERVVSNLINKEKVSDDANLKAHLQLRELTGSIVRQKFAAEKRLEAYAATAGDLKEVIPMQAKRFKEPETVLTFARLLRDPQWSGMFLDFIQHRFGLDWTRQLMQRMETSLDMGTDLSSARNANELIASLAKNEGLYQKRSDEIAAKFQSAENVTTDAREVAFLETLAAFLENYSYWTNNRNREE